MKKFFLILTMVVTIAFIACNDNATSNETSTTKTDTRTETNNNVDSKNKNTIDKIIAEYLNLKNALTDDNANGAANAAKAINQSLASVDESALTAEQKKIYDEVKDDIKEHAEHIAGNSSNIGHQREHFELLSSDITDIVKTFGSSQTLYREYCPMYNNKKGAYWISETKEIKNPYYGKEMLKCGEVKEEMKAKE